MRSMHDLFETWSKGLFTLAPYDVPFTAFGKAMAARRKLVELLEQAVEGERTKQAVGRAGTGTLAALVASEEDGVRCGALQHQGWGSGHRTQSADVKHRIILWSRSCSNGLWKGVSVGSWRTAVRPNEAAATTLPCRV